jgi:hypothetical protein
MLHSTEAGPAEQEELLPGMWPEEAPEQPVIRVTAETGDGQPEAEEEVPGEPTGEITVQAVQHNPAEERGSQGQALPVSTPETEVQAAAMAHRMRRSAAVHIPAESMAVAEAAKATTAKAPPVATEEMVQLPSIMAMLPPMATRHSRSMQKPLQD